MLHRLRVSHVSVALLIGSAVCLSATVWLVVSSGALVYFLTFHTPLHLQLAAAVPAYSQPALPSFVVQGGIGQTKLSAPGTQAIRVTVTPQQTIRAYLEIWVRGPSIRELYKYPANVDAAEPLQFIAGQVQVFNQTYTLPSDAAPGTYTVSASIVSVDQQIDYYNAHNFASFEVL